LGNRGELAQHPYPRHQYVLSGGKRQVVGLEQPVVAVAALGSPADALTVQIQLVPLIGRDVYAYRLLPFRAEAVAEGEHVRRFRRFGMGYPESSPDASFIPRSVFGLLRERISFHRNAHGSLLTFNPSPV
jgi:hypothetical protein